MLNFKLFKTKNFKTMQEVVKHEKINLALIPIPKLDLGVWFQHPNRVWLQTTTCPHPPPKDF